MKYKLSDNLLAIRLYAGENLMRELRGILTTIDKYLAVTLSAAGMFENPEIGFFTGNGKYLKKTYGGIFEIVSLSGNIIREKESGEINVHLHVSLADKEHRVIGGHLFSAVVYGTCELFLNANDVEFTRKLEEETGLKGLII